MFGSNFIRLLWFVAASAVVWSASAQNTALIMDSPPGDYIGQGQNYYFTATDGSFTASQNYDNGVSLSFNGSSHWFYLDFAAPGNALLTPGTYTGATRFPFQSSNQPGLSVDGDGRGSNTLTGFFTIKQIVYGSGNTIVAFDATFSQRSEGVGPPLTGEILFNSSNPLPPKNHFTSPLTAYATKGQPFIYQVKTSRADSSYSAQNLPSGLTIDTTTGLISGSATAEGEFQVNLATVSPDGNATAILDLTVTPAWQSTGPYSALQMHSDAGDWIGNGQSYSFSSTDGSYTGSGSNNHVSIYFQSDDGYESWYLNFSASTGSNLGLSTYQNCTRFASSNHPGLDISGDGRGSNDTTGSFTVKEISFDSSGALQSFHASFVQHSEGAKPALTGTIWYNAVNAITSNLTAYGKEKQSFTYQIVANNEPASFTATGLPDGLSLDVQSGLITGIANQSGSFPVILQAIGSSTVTETLNLTIFPSESLGNISTRLQVGTGDNVLIGGFIINGVEPKQVIVRAIGPSLSQYGVSGALSDTTLELHDQSGSSIAVNDDWRKTQIGGLINADQRQAIIATGFAPKLDLESAILVTLPPGAYTAIVRGYAGSTGVGLVEIYDLSHDANARLANTSARGFINTGDDIMIGGFIIRGLPGSGGGIIVRALGPSLAGYGVDNVLADPKLELYDPNGSLIAANDNWEDTQETEIEATGFAPSKPSEAAILTTQPPGAFTAIVRGTNGTTGNALIEIYSLWH